MVFRPAGKYGKASKTGTESDLVSFTVPVETVGQLKGLNIDCPSDVAFRLLVDDDEILNFKSDNAAGETGLVFDPPLMIKGNRVIYIKVSHSYTNAIEIVYNINYYVEDIVASKLMPA